MLLLQQKKGGLEGLLNVVRVNKLRRKACVKIREREENEEQKKEIRGKGGNKRKKGK